MKGRNGYDKIRNVFYKLRSALNGGLSAASFLSLTITIYLTLFHSLPKFLHEHYGEI